MGANPHANGGMLLRDLRIPHFRDYAIDVPSPRDLPEIRDWQWTPRKTRQQEVTEGKKMIEEAGKSSEFWRWSCRNEVRG